MLRMTSTTTNMVNVLAILCLVNEIGPLSGEIYSNIRLCEFFSNEATRERLKLCQKGGNIQVARVRRDVNRTQQSSISPTITTTKRGSHAYTCRRPLTAPNGFPQRGNGVELIVKWTRDKDMWSADITWEMPKPKDGRAICIGYVIQWQHSKGSAACDYVTEEDATSYSISSRKGWISTCTHHKKLFIAVLPLPFLTLNGQIQYREYEPPKCQDPKDKTTANASPVTTTVITPSTAESKTVESTVMNSANKTKTGPSSSTRTSDYNECEPESNIHIPDCGTGATCTNQVGTYSCQCNPGFVGTPPECKVSTTPKPLEFPNADDVELVKSLVIAVLVYLCICFVATFFIIIATCRLLASVKYVPEEDEISMGAVSTIVTPKHEDRPIMKEYYS